MTDIDLTNLSDEEIMNMEAPPEEPKEVVVDPVEPKGGTVVDDVVVDPITPEPTPEEIAAAAEEDKVKDPVIEDPNLEKDVLSIPDKDVKDTIEDLGDDKTKTPDPDKPIDKKEEKPKVLADDKTKAKTDDKDSFNYKDAYELIMKPFKANGKEIKLDNPEEAVKLMQMGANYTKKLQALQPNLKVVKMLENNGLLDEGKLNYLIDLSNKNPEAIQKLIKDSGIDPLDIDTTQDPKYTPGNHNVSDTQINFEQTLDDVYSSPKGSELVKEISDDWDQTSKDAIYKDPQILSHLNDQKTNGIYDQISGEVEKQKLLGNLKGVSFLQSYFQVGKALQERNLLVLPEAAKPAVDPVITPQTETKQVIAETVATRDKPDPNADKIKAASPVKVAGTKEVTQDFNPLSMSDEDFMNNAEIAKRL